MRNVGNIETNCHEQDTTREDAIRRVKNLNARIVMVTLVVFSLILIATLTILTHSTILPLIGRHIMPLAKPLSHGFLPAIKNFIDHHIGLTIILACGIFVLIDLTKQKNRLEEDYGLESDETSMNLQDLLSEIGEYFQQVTERLGNQVFGRKKEEGRCVIPVKNEDINPSNEEISNYNFFDLSTHNKDIEYFSEPQPTNNQNDVHIEKIPNENYIIQDSSENKATPIQKLDNEFCKQAFEKKFQKKFNWSEAYKYSEFFTSLKLAQIEKQPELLKSENNQGLGEIEPHLLIEKQKLEPLIKEYGLRILLYYIRESNIEDILNIAWKHLSCQESLQEINKHPSNLNQLLENLKSQASTNTSTNNEVAQEDVDGVYRLLVQALIYQHPELLSRINHSRTLTLLCQEKKFLESLVNVHGLYILCYINNEQSLQLAKKYKAAFQFSYNNHKNSIQNAFHSANEKNIKMPNDDSYNPFYCILNDKKDSMQIFVRDLNGITKTLEVYPDTKIEEVCFLLKEQYNSEKFVSIVFDSKHRTHGSLKDNKVSKDSTLNVTGIKKTNGILKLDN